MRTKRPPAGPRKISPSLQIVARAALVPPPETSVTCFRMASDLAKLAREHLERAEPHVPDGDVTQAITWLHLAAEAAVEAIAEVRGIDTMKQHSRKAKVAHQFFEDGDLSVDLRPTLILLNEARKSTNYSGSNVDLEDRNLEDLYEEIETAVTEAESAT